LYAGLFSGALRLPNGNTLIAAGVSGHMFEIGADNAVVWEFTNPYVEDNDPQSTQRIAAAFGAGGERGANRGGRRGPPPATVPPAGEGDRSGLARPGQPQAGARAGQVAPRVYRAAAGLVSGRCRR